MGGLPGRPAWQTPAQTSPDENWRLRPCHTYDAWTTSASPPRTSTGQRRFSPGRALRPGAQMFIEGEFADTVIGIPRSRSEIIMPRSRRGCRSGHGPARPAAPSAGPRRTAVPGARKLRPHRAPRTAGIPPPSRAGTRPVPVGRLLPGSALPPPRPAAWRPGTGHAGRVASPWWPATALEPRSRRARRAFRLPRSAAAPRKTTLRVDRLRQPGSKACAMSAFAHRAERLVSLPQVLLGRDVIPGDQLGPAASFIQIARSISAPGRSSASRSAGTTWPLATSSNASRARCLGPPRPNTRPSRNTCTGPRMPNSTTSSAPQNDLPRAHHRRPPAPAWQPARASRILGTACTPPGKGKRQVTYPTDRRGHEVKNSAPLAAARKAAGRSTLSAE